MDRPLAAAGGVGFGIELDAKVFQATADFLANQRGVLADPTSKAESIEPAEFDEATTEPVANGSHIDSNRIGRPLASTLGSSLEVPHVA